MESSGGVIGGDDRKEREKLSLGLEIKSNAILNGIGDIDKFEEGLTLCSKFQMVH